MNKFLISTMSVLMMAPAFAKNVSELALDCTAQYKVLESRNYFIPAHYRVPDRDGTLEVQEILNISGKDCQKMEKHYGIVLKPGQVLGKGAKIPAGGHFTGDNDERIGQIFEEKVQQSFFYKEKDGTLPLFPLVHNEWAELLGVSGQANAKALYGTPEVASIPELTKLKLVDNIGWIINHGKELDDSDFLNLVLTFEFKTEAANKEFIQDILLWFQNAAKFKSMVVTLDPLTKIGGKLNQLLNATGGTKWQTKLQVFQKNPLLFHEQIIQWSFDGVQIPKLDSGEMEEFLAFALDVSKNLKNVPQVHEAQVLLGQYKRAATSIEYLQNKFELSTKAHDLIKEIVSL